jgi:DNA invertase Pin-like site-specific DNA recombinase
METIEQPIQYCLYARKSSESDERQAMSIDSQIKEMKELASKEGLIVSEIRKESHSAKNSGQRPVFMQLLGDIRENKVDGILTWAPDRLSRNAGDLGMLVDLMDQEKLHQIRTFSQAFSNNPNEKFLLMILCSQAKLENDQKGLNVKRGIRAKCEMGWRPGPAPLGYINRSFAGVKEISLDADRAPFVKQMFERVLNGASGRDIKKWADSIGFNYKSGKPLTLSQIYRMLKDPFYYGEFEFPKNSGVWYRGAHESIISRETFLKVREKMKVPPKSK